MKVPETITQELARMRRRARTDTTPGFISNLTRGRRGRLAFNVLYMPASYQDYNIRGRHLRCANVGYWVAEMMSLPNRVDAIIALVSWDLLADQRLLTDWVDDPPELRIVTGPRSGNE